MPYHINAVDAQHSTFLINLEIVVVLLVKLKTMNSGHQLPVEVTAGSRATDDRELRQARKGAAVTVLDVCRGGAWLSLVLAICIYA